MALGSTPVIPAKGARQNPTHLGGTHASNSRKDGMDSRFRGKDAGSAGLGQTLLPLKT